MYQRRKNDRTRRIVLITGAGSGIGRALCEVLTVSRDDFVIAVDRDAAALDALRAWHSERRAHGLECLVCDVTDAESVAQMARVALRNLARPDESSVVDSKGLEKRLSHIHAIVHLAGCFGCGPLAEVATADEVRRCLEVNVMGVVNVTQHFQPMLPTHRDHLVRGARSRVVVVTSELSAARVSPALTAPYAMSKFALEAYAAALRQELAVVDPPVHVCNVRPGPVLTPLATEVTEAAARAHIHRGSRWSTGLLALVTQSRQYTGLHGIEPLLAAEGIAQVVHAIEPPRCITINYTLPMRLAAWTPQWLLDWAMQRQMRAPPPRR